MATTSMPGDQTCPKMSEFDMSKIYEVKWCSDTFYTHNKMGLCVDAANNGK